MQTFRKFLEEASSCIVNKDELYGNILRIIRDKSIYNQKTPPANGELYGIDGTPESWARFYTELAGHESGYNACIPFKNDIGGVAEPGGSGGLFQLGRDQIEIWAKEQPGTAKRYGLTPGKDYTEQELYNADLNTRGMLFIGDALLQKSYAVGPRMGLGKTIGSMSWNKIAKRTPTSSPSSKSALAKNTQQPGATDTKIANTQTANAGGSDISSGGGVQKIASDLIKSGLSDIAGAIS